MSSIEPPDTPDDELEALVADALAPVTDTHRATAVAAFAWRDLDAELAQLVETAAAPALRNDPQTPAYGTALTYSTSDGAIVVDVEQTSAGTAAVVVFAEVESELTACAMTSPNADRRSADMVDRTAVFTDVASGSIVRFELQRNDSVIAVTPWMTI